MKTVYDITYGFDVKKMDMEAWKRARKQVEIAGEMTRNFVVLVWTSVCEPQKGSSVSNKIDL
jgi:hypothetical protein